MYTTPVNVRLLEQTPFGKQNKRSMTRIIMEREQFARIGTLRSSVGQPIWGIVEPIARWGVPMCIGNIASDLKTSLIIGCWTLEARC